MKDKYQSLKLENQLCFPLYACSKEIVRRYKPYLDEIDLTYTQYITMMAMWEHKSLTVKELGQLLYLDSGTLTPVLKKLEKKGFIERRRSEDDERSLDVSLTKKGETLRDRALKVPEQMASCINLEPDEALNLYKSLNKIMHNNEGER
ncbi:MAG: MarR family winged helix-turn-helix transcriptional regulator [Suipraeoptans sp.]